MVNKLGFKKKVFLVAIESLVFLALYFVAAHIAESRGVQTSWLASPIDSKIPFMPGFVWIYLSAYVQATLGICLAVWHLDERRFKQVLAAMYFNLAISFLFHILFPLAAAEPTVDHTSPSGFAMITVQWMATKYNTFPSEHVSFSIITAWAALMSFKRNRFISLVLIVDAIAIIFSTLFTKQHVLIDVVGGAVAAAMSIWFAKTNWVPRRKG